MNVRTGPTEAACVVAAAAGTVCIDILDVSLIQITEMAVRDTLGVFVAASATGAHGQSAPVR